MHHEGVRAASPRRYMVNVTSPHADPTLQRAEIRARVEWLTDDLGPGGGGGGGSTSAGFDFIATESGLSEVTHPTCAQMLALIDELAQSARARAVPTYIKCHCSAGQKCDANHSDPRTGAPLDFNFLPMLADSAMGVMPHTVQVRRVQMTRCTAVPQPRHRFSANVVKAKHAVSSSGCQPPFVLFSPCFLGSAREGGARARAACGPLSSRSTPSTTRRPPTATRTSASCWTSCCGRRPTPRARSCASAPPLPLPCSRSCDEARLTVVPVRVLENLPCR